MSCVQARVSSGTLESPRTQVDKFGNLENTRARLDWDCEPGCSGHALICPRCSPSKYTGVHSCVPELARVCMKPSSQKSADKTHGHTGVCTGIPNNAKVNPGMPGLCVPGHTRVHPGTPGNTRTHLGIPGHSPSVPGNQTGAGQVPPDQFGFGISTGFTQNK